MQNYSRGYHSVFWPIILIGIGTLWLLGNFGLIPQMNFLALGRLWPMILIIIGLDILFGRRSLLGSAVIGLVTVGAILFFLLAGQSLGLGTPPAKNSLAFQEPVGVSTSAVINLELSSARTSIYPLDDSSSLIKANIDTFGRIDFKASGEQEKNIQLREINDHVDWLNPSNWSAEDMRWDIGLSPNIPLKLKLDAASGSSSLDLTRLKLTDLKYNGASGSTSIQLPESSTHYLADLEGASGSMRIQVPCSDIEVRINGASGSQNVEVAAGCPMRVDVQDTGSGSINLPSTMTRSEGGGNDRHQVTGIWESANLAAGKPFVLVTIANAGSGSINIH